MAQLTIHDRARYQRYVAAFMPVLAEYGRQLPAADEHPDVIEGQGDRHKVVLLAFPDREAYMTWATSPEYREISANRLAAADTITLLVRDVP